MNTTVGNKGLRHREQGLRTLRSGSLSTEAGVMEVTCANCGASLEVSSGAALRYVTREPMAEERAEYLVVESRSAADVLLHSCPIEPEEPMKAVVVYESMYGNTHAVANAIADGLRQHMDATVVPVHDADASVVAGADVVIVGGPTHAHGMSHAGTRKGAVTAAGKPGSDLVLDAGDDPDAYSVGLREWFSSLPDLATNAAAFDTRMDAPAAFTGRASKGIARKLRHHGAALLAEPESFFVTKTNHLEADEETRARKWGDRLGSLVDAGGGE